MFEHRTSPLATHQAFIRRLWRCALLSAGISAATLAVGMGGYHFLEGQSWVDAFANASMILAGMGPLGNLNTSGGKIFAGCYALFCGLIFVGVVTILIAPVFHRALHKFHLESKGKHS
jgi:xanthine/uracil permease